jgi:oxygen-dependent protoporphyrinogen oxidase
VKLAVVGGGAAGVAAAWELAGTGADVTLFEASDQSGGKVRTSPFAGRQVDEGADAFLARVPWALEICDELGITADLVEPAQRSAYVWARGMLRRLPAGLVLGVPTDLEALAASGIVDQPVTSHPDPTPLAPGADVSVGTLIRRQLGDQVLERLVDPLLGGINAGSADELSVRACAPQLAAAAERDRDLLAGLRAAPAPAPGPLFLAPRGGMGTLLDALRNGAEKRGAQVCTGSPVHDLASLLAGGFDGVVLATPAPVTAGLVAPAAPMAAGLLQGIRYASVIMVTLAVPADAVSHPLDGTGFIVPHDGDLDITAVSWATSKWAHLGEADPDSVVLRVSLGRMDDQRALGWDDDTLLAVAARDLGRTVGLRGPALESRIVRFPDALPQYTPGHLDRVAAIEADLAERLPVVTVGGAAYRGLGVPACLRQGREAARALVDRLGG